MHDCANNVADPSAGQKRVSETPTQCFTGGWSVYWVPCATASRQAYALAARSAFCTGAVHSAAARS
eukprot:scaffold50214_cov65-Phaeocystis_antarctica.AAC.1